MINKESLAKMNYYILEFMAEYGHYPAMKQLDEEINNLEERLFNRLKRAQVGLESQFINALRDRGYLPTDEFQRNELIDLVLNAPFNQMKEIIAEDGLESALYGRQITMEELINQGVDIAVSEFSEEVAEQLKEKIYTFSEDTFSRIKGDFANTLSETYAEGEGIDNAAQRLREDFSNLRDYRLRNIARTEIQGSQNEGIHETMNELEVEYKQWITVGDSRVRGNGPYDRADHIALHGEVVRIDEPFSNGLMHPLDRTGPIEQWINCRCRERPYIPRSGETIVSTPYYP